MELEQAQKRVEELRAVIERNNRLYYDQDAPELEDFEYDALTRELKALEAQFPQLITPTSPTQKVGGTPSGRFTKVTHAVKMESLLDAFSYDELRDFDRRVRDAGIEPEYVVEIKIDGLSCSLEYENGELVRASTRGDGVVGEDVTQNVRAIKRIPKTLKNAPEFLEVRGEVYMPHEAFQKLCAEQELQGAAPFKNPAQCGGRIPAPEGCKDHRKPRPVHFCVQRPADPREGTDPPFGQSELPQEPWSASLAALPCGTRH